MTKGGRKTFTYVLVGIFILGLVYLFRNRVEGFQNEMIVTKFARSTSNQIGKVTVPKAEIPAGATKLKDVRLFAFYGPDKGYVQINPEKTLLGLTKSNYLLMKDKSGEKQFYSTKSAPRQRTNILPATLPSTLENISLNTIQFSTIERIDMKGKSLGQTENKPQIDSANNADIKVEFVFE